MNRLEIALNWMWNGTFMKIWKTTERIQIAKKMGKFYAMHKEQWEAQKDKSWQEQFLWLTNAQQKWQKLSNKWGLFCEETERWLENCEWKIGQKILNEIKQQENEIQLKRAIKFKDKTNEKTLSKERLMKVLRQMQEHEISRGIEDRVVQWDVPLTREALYGAGMDERVVELPLAVEVICNRQGVDILDAGAALNVSFLKGLISSFQCHMVHFTQSGYKEVPAFRDAQYSYVFGDLRGMIFKDNSFHHVLCISTLEHIGMDNSRYGGAREFDPDSYVAALREIYRVLKPSGTLMITVPFGAYANRGWYQVFTHRHIAEMIKVFRAPVQVKFYKYEKSWFELVAEDQKELAGQHVTPSDSVDQIAVIKACKT